MGGSRHKARRDTLRPEASAWLSAWGVMMTGGRVTTGGGDSYISGRSESEGDGPAGDWEH